MVHQWVTGQPHRRGLSSPPRSPRRLRSRRFWLGSLLFLSLTLTIAYKRLQVQVAQPQAAVVLGGLETRESYAAQLAHDHPQLDIWVSSGSPEGYVEQIFANAGVGRDRLHLNYEAKDTVTNFTTLLDELQQQGVTSVYLITSENHMRRARIVGEIVFGSRGIVIKPLPVESPGPDETLTKCAIDGLRAVLWLITGRTGADFKEKLTQAIEF
ncbi:MAG: YdcF family protein [Cyanobacteria bacterium P01_G01_bin.54]